MTLHTEAIHSTALTAAHADEVLAIHQLGIDEGNATFETTAPRWEAFDTARLANHRHVAVDHRGRVLGWTAATAYGVTSSSSSGAARR
ncbi:hypothetical protein VT50_0224550 [Streptomyces antioxidans]|uniref:GNAT family N-acetyltransferase n=1 Tax=Streptomyces antioxidans TaxID=1507734 RepID=A0A1V4D0X2_9ACTN|nr:hypothetical protein VT50_0224550 [Streptomyces antioxidans]